MPVSATNEIREPSGDHCGDIWLPGTSPVRRVARPPSIWRTKIRAPAAVPAAYATSFPSGEIAGIASRSALMAIGVVAPTVMGGVLVNESHTRDPMRTTTAAIAATAIHFARALPTAVNRDAVGAMPPL